jgi:hypothetical protein
MMRRLLTLTISGLLLAPVAARPAELRARGLLDLVLVSGSEAVGLNRLTQGDSNFDPYRVHVFLDAKVSPTLDVYVQTILHEGAAKTLADGAYAQWTPWPSRDAHVQAGKIPWPVGTWAPRTYSDKNPLVGMPLMYEYHTSLAWNVAAASVDQLVSAAGQGQYGVNYGGNPGAGMPVVDDRWWDVGVVALGSQRPIEYSIGTIQGSPGWPVTGADNTPGQTFLGRLGIMPAAEIRAGVSGVYGTWMPEWFRFRLPPGGSLRDYHESIGMADLEIARGPWELRSEGFLKEWQTITTGKLRLHGGYAEARAAFGDGAWLAARYDMMRFSDVTTSLGVTRPWDDGIDRIEAGAGFRVNRDWRLKATFQRNVLHPFQADDKTADLYALAASIKL